MLLIIYFTLIEIHSWIKLKKKYFHLIWSFIQWGTILCSWTGLGIYVWRFHEGSRLNEIFHQTNGSKYLNIQLAVYIDEILSFLLMDFVVFSVKLNIFIYFVLILVFLNVQKLFNMLKKIFYISLGNSSLFFFHLYHYFIPNFLLLRIFII